MNQERPRNKLSPRDKILVNAVRVLQSYDEKFGDPKVVASCAGELQRVFLNYAIKSRRRLTAAELSAVDESFTHIARIACGPLVYEDNYVTAGAFLAIAGESALHNTAEAEPVGGRSEEAEAEVQKALEQELSVTALEGPDKHEEEYEDNRPH